MAKLTDEQRADMQRYIDFYSGQENVYGNKGWPMSIAYALDAALKRIDELESQVNKPRRKKAAP